MNGGGKGREALCRTSLIIECFRRLDKDNDSGEAEHPEAVSQQDGDLR